MNAQPSQRMTPLSNLHNIVRAPKAVAAYINHQPMAFTDWQDSVREQAAIYAQQSSMHYLLWCQSTYHFSVQLFALWLANKVVVLPPNIQPDNVQGYVSSIDAVVTDLAVDGSVFSSIGKPIYPAQSAHTHSPNAKLLYASMLAAQQRLERDVVKLILFTSGSSGEPKAVSRTLAQLEAELAGLHAEFTCSNTPSPDVADKANEITTVIGAVPHHHIYGLLFRVLWPLAEGWPFVNEIYDYPEPLLACLQKYAPATFIASPAQLSRFPENYDWPRFRQSVERVFSSGAPLTLATATLLFETTGNAPIEVLGSTETGGVATRQRQGGERRWKALPGVEYQIAASELLLVRSAAACTNDWFAMGDRAERHEDGSFSLLGRADRIVKVEGKRLSLQEMEKQLLLCAEIQSCALTVCYHNRDIVAAVIVLSESGIATLNSLGRKMLAERLRAHLLPHFERVLLPRWFRYVSHLPLDERGKLTQQNLQKLFSAQESE